MTDPRFAPMRLGSACSKNECRKGLRANACSGALWRERERLPSGDGVFWGIPFALGDDGILAAAAGQRCAATFERAVSGRYIVFLHASDIDESETRDRFYRPHAGIPALNHNLGSYIMHYEDGGSEIIELRQRMNINEWTTAWGNDAFLCVPHNKPASFPVSTEEVLRDGCTRRGFGHSQFRTQSAGEGDAVQLWLYAWENPRPEARLIGMEVISTDRTILLAGLTAANVSAHPLRWNRRSKMILDLNEIGSPSETAERGIIPGDNIEIDMGEVISVLPALRYPKESWQQTRQNLMPEELPNRYIIEYAAHPDARLRLCDLRLSLRQGHAAITAVEPAETEVRLIILDDQTGKPVAAKLHVHGEHGEYLSPLNRHRQPNPYFFEDYSADFVHGRHLCTYVDGSVTLLAPQGNLYVELTKGFEMQPYKAVLAVDDRHTTFEIRLKRSLGWRARGWVTADTHVHFLSPQTALLEGAAEDVNIVNLLASQWGELFTNAGDFDGKTTIGAGESGDGEYLVRVGTENRQHILGHISLLGYEGEMILPLTTGGPDESALGDAVETTLCEWARRARLQNGLAILPHFPNPRAEGAAALILERIDGVEMTSWGDLYGGISPYSLSDWYRYLNCGYLVPAVGGTDKMSATTAVGTVRTYAQIKNSPFTYETWKDAVRKGNTFVTYGPLVDMVVQGMEMGSTLELPAGGGHLDIAWTVASAVLPVTAVELIVNGDVRGEKTFDGMIGEQAGSFSCPVARSAWVALRVRGAYADKPEMIAAHTSAVMCVVGGERCLDAADAMTILEQIEAVRAYVSTLGTQARERAFHEIMMTLTSAHRALHNRMHQMGMFHSHAPLDNHPGH